MRADGPRIEPAATNRHKAGDGFDREAVRLVGRISVANRYRVLRGFTRGGISIDVDLVNGRAKNWISDKISAVAR